jgi:hypothetical protein
MELYEEPCAGKVRARRVTPCRLHNVSGVARAAPHYKRLKGAHRPCAQALYSNEATAMVEQPASTLLRRSSKGGDPRCLLENDASVV